MVAVHHFESVISENYHLLKMVRGGKSEHTTSFTC